MNINKKLLDIFKKTKTTSDEYTYTCSYINDLEDNISGSINLKQSKIKTMTKTLTTDSSGNIITGLNTNDHILLSAYQRSGNAINGFVSIYTYNGNYYVHTSNFNGTALSGTADFEIVYIDR